MIYPLFLLLILVLWNYSNSLAPGRVHDKFENKACFIIWTIIVLLSAFRADSVGADTIGYRSSYNNMSTLYLTFADVADRYDGYLGYYFPSKAVSMAKMPVWVWFGIVQAFYAYSMQEFITRHSNDKLFSILIFVTIGLYSFSVAGLKQVVSMSWIMLAFLMFEDKKYLWTFLFVIIAYTCHSCALIFIGAFILYYLRNNRFFLPALISFIVISYFFADVLLIQMVNTLNDEHFEVYLEFENSYKATTLIFYFILVCLSYPGFRLYKFTHQDIALFFYGLCLTACGMQAMASVSSNAFRLAYFYTPFFMIVIPNTCVNTSIAHKKIIRILFVFVLIVYFLYSGRNQPYEFFFMD